MAVWEEFKPKREEVSKYQKIWDLDLSKPFNVVSYEFKPSDERKKDLENKVARSIERLKIADEMSRKYYNQPLYVCLSGGKDSCVLTQLVIESGLDVIFSNSHTTVDTPETVYFIREEMKRLRELGYKTQILKPKLSMWKLISDKHNGMLPYRTVRYCCLYFKERPVVADKRAFIVTGVRWSESSQRSTRMEFEAQASVKKNAVRIAANDNELSRKLFEDCKLRGERICNPIIDWTDRDVWDYLNWKKVKVNVMYALGWKRIGCVGCPMTNLGEREVLFAIYPQYKRAYINAVKRGVVNVLETNKPVKWVNDDVRNHVDSFVLWRYKRWMCMRGVSLDAAKDFSREWKQMESRIDEFDPETTYVSMESQSLQTSSAIVNT